MFVQSDTWLIADRFEDFRNMCLEIHELDPAQSFTALQVPLQATLKKAKVKLVNQYFRHNLCNGSYVLVLLPAMLLVICNATYYHKNKRRFKVRMCKHLGNLALTGKRVIIINDSAVKKYLLFCNHTTHFKRFLNSHYQ